MEFLLQHWAVRAHLCLGDCIVDDLFINDFDRFFAMAAFDRSFGHTRSSSGQTSLMRILEIKIISVHSQLPDGRGRQGPLFHGQVLGLFQSKRGLF